MKTMRWRQFSAAALVAALVAGGAIGADHASTQVADQGPAKGVEQTIILREHGKPDRTCIIEKSTPQADGTVLHEVRDSATGERMRVLDQRKNKSSVGSVMARVSGPNAMEVAAATKQDPDRVPTNAELAGQPKVPTSPYAQMKSTPRPDLLASRRPAPKQLHPALLPQQTESPVQAQLQKLKEALGPSEREMAALWLAVSDARRDQEVVSALVEAAKTDPAPSVRCCLVRCLFHISADAPEVVPVLEKLQADPNEDVKKSAQNAMQGIVKAAKKPAQR